MNARSVALQLVMSVIVAVAVSVVHELVRERRAGAILPQGPVPGYGKV